jgi:4-hydroxy-2-oxoheptanedioate aldolase
MRANRVREIWRAGGAVVNGWCGIPDSFAAEVMAHMGWDSIVVDLQHGVVDYQAMVRMLQAISTTSVVPLVRVPWNDPAMIMKALDAGAYGIICPMVNSRPECEAFVGACRYAPRGYRSSGPVRASLYGGPDYHAKADDEIVTLAMIETRQALENVDVIAATPELDALYVGPSDLSLSLGHGPGQDKGDDYMMAALKKILAAAKKHKIKACMHTVGTDFARKMVAMGFDFVTVSNDIRLLSSAGQQAVKEMREPIAKPG